MANEKRLIDMGRFHEVLRRYLNAPHVRIRGHIQEGMRMAISSCIELLEAQRPVDAVEVVHGRWDKNWEGDNIVYCDQCYMPQDMPTPYCSSCGAKMDGDGNG